MIFPRANLIQRLLSELRIGLASRYEKLALYLIGSTVKNGFLACKDLDLLMVDLEASEPLNAGNLEHLVDCMRTGDPFAGSFDAASPDLRNWLAALLDSTSADFPDIAATASFAFGPAKGELNIPDGSLHVHFCGPLTRGDLRSLASIMPFHAADFLTNCHSVIGPPLATLLESPHPTVRDLLFWDELLLRRFVAAPSMAARRKWLKRMLLHRTILSAYDAKHSGIIAQYSAAVENATLQEMQTMISILADSAKALRER